MCTVSHFSLFLFTVCFEEYTDNFGDLTSPNYPNKYPNNLDCVYTITVGFNEQIELEFTNFSLEDRSGQTCFDFVEIRYGLFLHYNLYFHQSSQKRLKGTWKVL